MDPWIETMATVAISVFASSGFWAFMGKKTEKKDALHEMVKGLGHDRITFLGEKYVERGYVTKDEYENLHDYLYEPYKEMGGNGSAKKIMEEVEKLPIKKIS